MKTVTVAYAESNLSELLRAAQKERVVVTSAGKPTAVVIGLGEYDDENLRLARSDDFWRLIEERRRPGKSIPLSDLKARLEKQAGRRPRKAKARPAQAKRKSSSPRS